MKMKINHGEALQGSEISLILAAESAEESACLVELCQVLRLDGVPVKIGGRDDCGRPVTSVAIPVRQDVPVLEELARRESL